MGLFSRLFKPKNGRRWAVFDRRPNDAATLAEKGRALAPILIRSSADHAVSLQAQVLPELVVGQIFFESQILDLHLVDRIAFSILGGERRSWFMDSLFDEEIKLMSTVGEQSEVLEMRKAFTSLYPQRMQMYATGTLFPEKNELGGENLRGTIGWKFGEILGADTVAQIVVVTLSGQRFSTLVNNLQIPELLEGYR